MKLACSSYSYHEELENGMEIAEFFRICEEELQINGVELIDEHLPGSDTDSLDYVADLAAEHGLDIACLSVFYNDFAKEAHEDRREDINKVKKWLDNADHLGAAHLRAFTGFPGLHNREHGDSAVWRDVTISLQECIDYARSIETTLAIENHNHDGLIQTADDVFRLRSEVNGELGLVLDLANYIDGRESVERSLHLADHVHAAYDDVDADGADPTYPYYPEILTALTETGYEGFITLEWEGEENDFEAVPRAINYLQDIISD